VEASLAMIHRFDELAAVGEFTGLLRVGGR
jgi:hypothetical protein